MQATVESTDVFESRQVKNIETEQINRALFAWPLFSTGREATMGPNDKESSTPASQSRRC